MLMNKKWQLVSAGLLTTVLLTSNVVLAHQYKIDTTKYEKKIKQQNNQIKSQNKLIKSKEYELIDKQDIINNLDKTIQQQSSELHSLQQQLEKATVRNESPSRQLTVEASAYVSFCSEGCIGKTRLGIDVSKSIYYNGMRIIAVDPLVIKLHSIVRVDTRDESFVAYAGDTGGGINGNEIDVLVSVRNTQKAFQFGRQNVTLTILRDGKGDA